MQANRGEFADEERKAQKEITLKVRLKPWMRVESGPRASGWGLVAVARHQFQHLTCRFKRNGFSASALGVRGFVWGYWASIMTTSLCYRTDWHIHRRVPQVPRLSPPMYDLVFSKPCQRTSVGVSAFHQAQVIHFAIGRISGCFQRTLNRMAFSPKSSQHLSYHVSIGAQDDLEPAMRKEIYKNYLMYR